MKAIKRTVAALLATLMLATSTSFTLAAENYTDDEAVVVAKVNAAGIMTGTDKGFEPSKSLTRAEAAAIIVRMKGISESAVKSMAGTTLFNDVAASHWASGYVNEASNLGIVKGVSAKEFAPDRDVTVAEFTTMAIRALGAGQLVDSEGTWPTNYVNFANENDLLKDVTAIYTATATRMNAATIVANTLTATMWRKVGVKSTGEIEWGKTNPAETILKDVLNITAYDKLNAKKCTAVSNTDHTFNTTMDVVETLDLSNIKVGMTYDYWKNDDDEIIGLWISESNKSSKVEFDEIVKYQNDEITLKVDGKEKKYDLAAAKINDDTATEIVVLYNEADGNASSLAKSANKSGVAYVSNGDITSIYITEFNKFGVIDEVTSTRVKFETSDVDGENCTNFSINNDDNEYFLTKNGSAMKFTDLKEGDAIKYYVVSGAHQKYVAEVITDVKEGTVTAKGTDYIKLDKVKYSLASALSFSVDDEVRVWFNAAGKVIMSEKIDSAASDIAVVKYIRRVTGKYGTEYEVELFYTDGTKSERLTADLENTFDEYKDANVVAAGMNLTVTGTDNKETEARKLFAATKPGMVVCYEVSGSSVTFKPAKAGDDAEYDELTVSTLGSVTDTYLEIGTKNAFVTNGMTKIYVDENTTFIKVKADGTYNTKCELVNFDDLEDTTYFAATSATSFSYVGAYDRENKEAKYVIFGIGTELNRSTETNFAYVTEVSTTKYDGNTAYEVDVIYANGNKETYLATKDELDERFDDLAFGMLIDLSVSGEMITDYDLLGGDLANPAEPTSDDTLGVIDETILLGGKLVKYRSAKDEITVESGIYTVADDCLVLSIAEDKETKYLNDEVVKVSVSSIDAIDEFDNLTDDNDRIVQMYIYQNDNGEKEVVAIVFVENKTTALTSIAATALTSVAIADTTTIDDVKVPVGSVASDLVVTTNASSKKVVTVTYSAALGYGFSTTANAYDATLPSSGYTFTSATASADGQSLVVVYTQA